MALDPKAQAALALHRFGVGPRAGSIAAIAADPRGALLAELDRPGAGRISAPHLASSGVAARTAFAFQQTQRAARREERAVREANAQGAGASAPGRSRSQRAATDLSRRGEGAHRCRARRRDRLCRAAGLVLVEPFL